MVAARAVAWTPAWLGLGNPFNHARETVSSQVGGARARQWARGPGTCNKAERYGWRRMGVSPVKRSAVCLMLMLAGSGRAFAWDSPAPDVVLYCSAALEAPLREVARRYRAASHVEVHLFVAPPDGLFGLIKHRARDDVVVADTATLGRLAAEKLIRPETMVALGTDPYVLITKADGASPGAAASALVAQHDVVLPDPTTAADFDGASVLRAATPPLSPAHVLGVDNTPEVASLVRGNGSLVGLVHRTEAQGRGVALAATLNTPPTPTAGALVTQGQSVNAAALLAFIAGPDGKAILQAAGLEPQS